MNKMARPYMFLIIMGLISIIPIAAEENNLPTEKKFNLHLNGGDSVMDNGDEEMYSPITTFEGKARKPWRNRNHPPPRKAPTNQGPPTHSVPSGGGGGTAGGSGGSKTAHVP